MEKRHISPMRRKLKTIATVLVGIALVAAGAALWFRPTVLRVAAGPVGSSDMRVIISYLQALQRERADIRFRLILTEGPADSAARMETGKADLAVVRSDVAMPAKASTVAILRRDAAFFITRPGSEITEIGGLKGKTVGLARSTPANERMLSQILDHYDLSPHDVTRVSGTPQEMQQQVADGTAVLEGDASILLTLAGALTQFELGFAIMPGTTPGEDAVPADAFEYRDLADSSGG